MAKGQNSSMTERKSGARGMKIERSFARDNSSEKVENPHGKDLGGSPTNLSHSLSGSSAVSGDK